MSYATAMHATAQQGGARARRELRGVAALAVAAIAAAIVIAPLPVATQSATAAGTAVGCDYADPGSGFRADNFCWIDFTGFDQAEAESAAGQPYSISLPGGYIATFTLRITGVAGYNHTTFNAVTLPTWTGSAYGQTVYTGIAGRAALYKDITPPGTTNTGLEFIFDDVEVTDALGASIEHFGLAFASSEADTNGEDFEFFTDTTWQRVDTSTTCRNIITGVGTDHVTCRNQGGAPYGNIVLQTDSPERASVQVIHNPPLRGGSAISIAFVTSSLTVNKVVDAGRAHPTDSFDLTITDSSGITRGTGTTGTATTGTTGEITVLSSLTGAEAFTLTETPTTGSGTELGDYAAAWSCTADGAALTPTAGADDASVSVSPEVGQHVECTVTNSLQPRLLELTKTSDGDGTEQVGDVINYEITATNTGDRPWDSGDPVTVVDDLTAVLDDATYNADATADLAGGLTYSAPRLVWTGALAPDETVTIRYSVTVTAAGDHRIRNSVYQAVPTDDPNTSVPCDPATGTRVDGAGPCVIVDDPLPGLAVSKSVSTTGTLAVGDTFTYSVTLRNTGEVDYTATTPATFIDDLTAVLDDATLDPATITSTSATAATFVSPRILWGGPLAVGESVTISYTLTYAGEGDTVVRNIAFVPSDDPGDDPSSTPTPSCYPMTVDGRDAVTGEPCAIVVVNAPDVRWAKQVDPTTGTQVQAGMRLTYSLLFTNFGTEVGQIQHVDALGGVLDDADVVVAATSSSPNVVVGPIDPATPTMPITGSIAPGETVSVTYQVEVRAWEAQGDHRLTNHLLITGSEVPPTGSDCPSLSATCTSNPITTIPVESNLQRTGVDPGAPIAVAHGAILLGLLAIGLAALRRRRTGSAFRR